MQKSTASYRMSRYTKRMLALGIWANQEQRHAWRRAMIDAELSSRAQPRPVSRDRSGGKDMAE
jgi:hypothetical protein